MLLLSYLREVLIIIDEGNLNTKIYECLCCYYDRKVLVITVDALELSICIQYMIEK